MLQMGLSDAPAGLSPTHRGAVLLSLVEEQKQSGALWLELSSQAVLLPQLL